MISVVAIRKHRSKCASVRRAVVLHEDEQLLTAIVSAKY
jgi:hypothetical protein